MNRAVEAICLALGLGEAAEGTVVLTDDAEIRSLNHQWRGLDESTDVLSFAMQEAPNARATPDLLGDVVISVETAIRLVAEGPHRERVMAAEQGEMPWRLGEELAFLAVHGVLHLLGYDHAEADEETEMRAKERDVLFRVLEAVGPSPG